MVNASLDSTRGNQLPIVQRLGEHLTPESVFEKICHLARVLWLDSSTGTQDAGKLDDRDGQTPSNQPRGRYSFLCADPVATIDARYGDPDPWPRFHRLSNGLPSTHLDGLPPFQGGVAGLVGYESLTWVEQVPVAKSDDLPTMSLSVGLYDWVIAFDHRDQRSWLISQGFSNESFAANNRFERARRRADEVLSLLSREIHSPGNADFSGVSDGSQAGDEPASAVPYRDRLPELKSNFTGEGFRGAVTEVIERIHAGDSFQVNVAQRLTHPATVSSSDLYRILRRENAAPFCGYYDAGAFQVLSSSPEGFLNVRGGRVETRPIKGTVPRTGDAERDARYAQQLMASQKDHAENVMIVDLMRNDLSRVCTDESVVVEQLCQIERYEFVQHLVSVVRGDLHPDRSVVDLLHACFPGGSVTGAPKVEAMRTIAQLEPNPRGAYCGSLGYISCQGDADWNILIRTITATNDTWQIPVGGGITARSDPAAEEAETWAKAEGMLRAIAKANDRSKTLSR